MPDTYPGIDFNDEGICNFCASHKPHQYLGENKLIDLVNSTKKISKFDCLIPLSGGKDSIFILYYAVKRLNLKAVAVNYDSGMQSEMALNNIKNATSILGVPLVIKSANKKLQRKRLTALINLQNRTGRFIYGCGDCVPILQAITIKYANDNDIPILFDGGSILEHPPKSTKKSKIPSKIESLLKYKFFNLDIIKYYYFIKYNFYNSLLNKEMGVGSVSTPPSGYKKYFTCGATKVIRFSDYICLSDQDKVKIISKELNWEQPQKKDKRFDCLLHCLSDLDSLKRCGITSNGIVYSNMIREGLMAREEALLKESYANKNLKYEYNELKDRLGL